MVFPAFGLSTGVTQAVSSSSVQNASKVGANTSTFASGLDGFLDSALELVTPWVSGLTQIDLFKRATNAGATTTTTGTTTQSSGDGQTRMETSLISGVPNWAVYLFGALVLLLLLAGLFRSKG